MRELGGRRVCVGEESPRSVPKRDLFEDEDENEDDWGFRTSYPS